MYAIHFVFPNASRSTRFSSSLLIMARIQARRPAMLRGRQPQPRARYQVSMSLFTRIATGSFAGAVAVVPHWLCLSRSGSRSRRPEVAEAEPGAVVAVSRLC
jgi:hypothetical protein